MPHRYPRRSLSDILDGLPLSKIESQEDARILCEYIGMSTNADLRYQVWDISAESVDPLRVKGYVSNPSGLNTLQQACERLDHACDIGGVETLPVASLAGKHFGLVTEPLAPILASPYEGSERLDSALIGSMVTLLREDGEHALVHAPSGYVGWVERKHYKQIETDEWVAWRKREHALLLEPILHGEPQVPANAMLPIEDGHLLLPEGEPIKAEGLKIRRSSEFQPTRQLLAETGRSLLGTEYVWGGNDGSGIDCSGFVRYCYRAAGFTLPRDADMQFLCGTVSALPGSEAAMELGDLLFFRGWHGRITHVALSLGGDQLIHAAGSTGVAIERLPETDRLKDTFIQAKRILL